MYNFSNMLSSACFDGSGAKKKMRGIDWEISRSSLAKIKKSPSYEECRKYACEDICANLTRSEGQSPFIIELPRGTKFNFMVRVGTEIFSPIGPNHPSSYLSQFFKRNYISFSIINNKNVSYYGLGGDILFAYDMTPEMICHVFPMDTDSDNQAIYEADLTEFPSLWLTLSDLNAATLKLRTYNQLSCRTKKEDGQIIRPSRIIAIDKINQEIESVAKAFGIGCTIIHPDKDAICETYDPFFPVKDRNSIIKTKKLFENLKKFYELDESKRMIPD